MGYGRPSGCNMRPLTSRHLAAALFVCFVLPPLVNQGLRCWPQVAGLGHDYGTGFYAGLATILWRSGPLPESSIHIWYNFGVVSGSAGAVVFMVLMGLAFVLSCVDIWRWACRKRDPVKPAEPQPERGPWPP